MGKIFITGDKHGDYSELSDKLSRLQTSKQNVVIILGDHGALYYEDHGADRKKKWLSSLPATFICIRGNHDHRPDCAAYSHEFVQVNEPDYAGQFYVDKRFPNVLFTKEYGWYRFGAKRVFVIGGAFSIDKYRRVNMQERGFTSYLWFSDEQLYPAERDAAQSQLAMGADGEFYVMSHTCPIQYIPRDAFLPGVNQSIVDNTMEIWLSEVEEGLKYAKWYCGHYHVNRKIDNICFLYGDMELFDETEESTDESVSQ